jgi:hypothetical protein
MTIPADQNPGLLPAELKMVATLLSGAAEVFSDHSNNDYFLPATPACREIVAAAIERKHLELGDDGGLKGVIEVSGQWFIYDDWLMTWFADRWGQLAQLSGSRPPIAREELAVVADLLRLLADNPDDMYADPLFEGGDGERPAHEDEDFTVVASLPNKAVFAAATRNSDSEFRDKRIRGILAADGEITTYAVWILQYLAKRCESLA